jgi:hypothetical protein
MKFINEISDKFLSAPINSSRWLFSFNTIQQNSKNGIKNFFKDRKNELQTFVVDDNQSLMEVEKSIDRV